MSNETNQPKDLEPDAVQTGEVKRIPVFPHLGRSDTDWTAASTMVNRLQRTLRIAQFLSAVCRVLGALLGIVITFYVFGVMATGVPLGQVLNRVLVELPESGVLLVISAFLVCVGAASRNIRWLFIAIGYSLGYAAIFSWATHLFPMFNLGTDDIGWAIHAVGAVIIGDALRDEWRKRRPRKTETPTTEQKEV